jgi:hypothetical protein
MQHWASKSTTHALRASGRWDDSHALETLAMDSSSSIIETCAEMSESDSGADERCC